LTSTGISAALATASIAPSGVPATLAACIPSAGIAAPGISAALAATS
jgi:hypothetical protein